MIGSADNMAPAQPVLGADRFHQYVASSPDSGASGLIVRRDLSGSLAPTERPNGRVFNARSD